MQLPTSWRKCEIHVFLDHKCFSICDSVTSLSCGFGEKWAQYQYLNEFQRKCHRGKKMNQQVRKAQVAAGSNSTWTGGKMPTPYNIHCRGLPQMSHLQCEHQKNKFLFIILHFFPFLFIVCYPGLVFWECNLACSAFACEEEKRYLAVIIAFAVFAMSCCCPLIFPCFTATVT